MNGTSLFLIPTQEILWGPAPIDWCEPNNPESNPWGIEEYHNTWSNVAYVIAGLVNALRLARSKSFRDPLLYWCCFFAIMTGVTSAWFHATLLYVGQKTDEFFENALMIAPFYALKFPLTSTGKETPNKMRYVYFLIHILLLGLGVFCISAVFCEVHLIIATLINAYEFRKRCAFVIDPVKRDYFISNNNVSIAWGIFGFALWAVDMVACSPIIQKLHLHAFAWHWATAFAVHLSLSRAITMEELILQQVKSS